MCYNTRCGLLDYPSEVLSFGKQCPAMLPVFQGDSLRLWTADLSKTAAGPFRTLP